MSKNRTNLFNSLTVHNEAQNKILTRLRYTAEIIRNTWAKVGQEQQVPDEYAWAFQITRHPVYGFRYVTEQRFDGRVTYQETTLDASRPNMNMLVEFVCNKTIHRVPVKMLTNDPIAVAQKVRATVKRLQISARNKQMADTKARMEAAEREYKELETQLELLNEAAEKRAAKIQRRAERIAYAKAQKAAEAAD